MTLFSALKQTKERGLKHLGKVPTTPASTHEMCLVYPDSHQRFNLLLMTVKHFLHPERGGRARKEKQRSSTRGPKRLWGNPPKHVRAHRCTRTVRREVSSLRASGLNPNFSCPPAHGATVSAGQPPAEGSLPLPAQASGTGIAAARLPSQEGCATTLQSKDCKKHTQRWGK